MEFMKLPDGVLSLVAAVIGNAILLVWYASAAASRLREHNGRLDRLEERVEDHADKLEKLMNQLEGRLGRIEATLDILASNSGARRGDNGHRSVLSTH